MIPLLPDPTADRLNQVTHLVRIHRKQSAHLANRIFYDLNHRPQQIEEDYAQKKCSRGCPSTVLALLTFFVVTILLLVYTQMSKKGIFFSALGLSVTAALIAYALLSAINSYLDREKQRALDELDLGD